MAADGLDAVGVADADAEAPLNEGKKGKYRKPKPWDHDGIDHWKVEAFKPEHSSGPFLEESSFVTLFPAYREKYLKEVWPVVTRTLAQYGVGCELNLIEGSMTVKTTRKTYDPYAIVRAKDLIKLLARSAPVEHAVRIMQDDMACDIIKIGNITRKTERFVKRRDRLIGPNGSTLKAMELLTDCYVLVQGNTVASIGTHKGLKQVRKIVIDCMNNIHPVYNIKILMIKRELAKDPQLRNENWERFLPTFKKRNVKSKKRPKPAADDATGAAKKKEYTPFPPLPPPSKLDLQLESGEYFLSEDQRRQRTSGERKERREESRRRKDAERARAFVPPEFEGRKEAGTDASAAQESAQALAGRLRDLSSRAADDNDDRPSRAVDKPAADGAERSIQKPPPRKKGRRKGKKGKLRSKA